MKNIKSWQNACNVYMKLPASSFLMSKKAAEAANKKNENKEKHDVRKVAHSWACTTTCICYLLCRWSTFLKGAALASAAELFRAFVSHFFADVVINFVFAINVRMSQLPIGNVSLQHIDTAKYQTLNIHHGLISKEDIMKLVPHGQQLLLPAFLFVWPQAHGSQALLHVHMYVRTHLSR